MVNSRITLLKRIIQQTLITTGVLRYNITYIPKLGAYRIALVGSREGISGSTLSKLIEALSSNGFVVWVKVSKALIFNVVYFHGTFTLGIAYR